MYFTGYNFCGYKDKSLTPTNVSNINSIKLQNGKYGELYISNESNSEYTNTIQQNWDVNTIIHALFNGNLNAGNVEFTVNNTTNILVKRREKGTFKWQTLHNIPVNSSDDCYFTKYDKYARSGVEYEYAIVPVTNGAEGNYNSDSIISEFEGIYLVEKETVFSTIYNLVVNTSKNSPISVIATLNGKYPFVISNSNNNYYTGSLNGIFMQHGCEYNDETYGKMGGNYRRQLDEFLMNGKPKILKHEDGRIWMINITGQPTESQGDHPYLPTTSFDFVEVGDTYSDKDMYENDFMDVESEWWVI